MTFKEFVRAERKKKYVSVKQFVKETAIDLSESYYYAIEKGNYNPSTKDLPGIYLLRRALYVQNVSASSLFCLRMGGIR